MKKLIRFMALGIFLAFLTDKMAAQTVSEIKTSIAVSSQTVVSYGSANNLVMSPTNQVVQIFVPGLDQAKAGQLEMLARQEGFSAVEIDFSLASVKVAGQPGKVTEASVKSWVNKNLLKASTSTN